MLHKFFHSIDYNFFAIGALGLFAFGFALMIYAVTKLSPSSAERFASIALSDHVEDPRDE